MTLALNPTLNEIRNEVLLRCGYSTSGNQSSAVVPMVNSMIAGAERELYSEAQWLGAMTRVEVELTEDNGTVDWPDEAEPGEIVSMWIVNSESGEATELLPGVMLNERNTADMGESGCPLLYEYMDSQIYLKPAPSENYLTLVVTYKRAPRLVEDSDRCVVDGELLIQRAVFKFKEFNQLPIGQVEMANHERYLARLRANNSNLSGYMMGGHKSWRTDTQRRNRLARSGRLGQSGYSADWNPWG
jgi:hypothetical protein